MARCMTTIKSMSYHIFQSLAFSRNNPKPKVMNAILIILYCVSNYTVDSNLNYIQKEINISCDPKSLLPLWEFYIHVHTSIIHSRLQ